MSSPFRDSPYVDFNAGVVHLDPMRFVNEHVGLWGLESEIAFFHCRVDVWQLLPAVQILSQIESHDDPSAWSHSAYALLFILTPYFEMVGKILNKDSNEYRTSDRDFNLGFCDMYPKHRFSQRTPGTTALGDNAFPYIGQLRDRMRNGLSHLGFTKKTFDIHNLPDIEDDFSVFSVGSSPADPNPIPYYAANPHRITRSIVRHFGEFVQRLRASTDSELQEKFLDFVGDFHDPHSMEMPEQR